MELINLPPDLKQNIFYMIYFIVRHNFLAILFAGAALFSLVLAIIRPSRGAIFMFLGFLLLLFSYEYIKHIKDPLREQTINSLVTIQPHNKVTRIVNFTLNKGLPLFLPGLGIMLVAFAFLSLTRSRLKTKRNRTS